jgi:hypothetical protein
MFNRRGYWPAAILRAPRLMGNFRHPGLIGTWHAQFRLFFGSIDFTQICAGETAPNEAFPLFK